MNINYNWRVNHFIETMKLTQPQFEYISGFIDNSTPVLIKCKICNKTQYRTPDRLLRKNKRTFCSNCEKMATKEKNEQISKIKKMIREQNKYMATKSKEKDKQINDIFIKLKQKTQYIRVCKKCNKEYIEHTKSIYCSKCRKELHHKHSNKSLHKLYKRDKGICYICGNKCDYEDYTYRGNTFIAGNYYPSIDHIIPISKGGTDEWNNLKLAHFKCNWVKGAGA